MDALKQEMGVPVAGESLDTSLRERASATPAHATQANAPKRTRASPELCTRDVRPAGAPLRALQEWFAGAVMHPVGVVDGVRELGAVGGESVGVDDVERVVAPSSQLTGLERVAIYHDAYQTRLIECLSDDYPALEYALGEPAFEALCRAYVARHPSRSPNLNSFGRHLSAFCRAQSDARSDFHADLAALEWAMVEVVHAAPAESLSEAALAAIPPRDWPRARFAPSDIVRVFEFRYPVNAYFQAYNTDGEPEVPEPAWSATAVFRDGPTFWRMEMSAAMHALLVALFAGVPLGDAIESLASAERLGEREAPLVMQWFRDWVRYGFFSQIFIEPTEP